MFGWSWITFIRLSISWCTGLNAWPLITSKFFCFLLCSTPSSLDKSGLCCFLTLKYSAYLWQIQHLYLELYSGLLGRYWNQLLAFLTSSTGILVCWNVPIVVSHSSLNWLVTHVLSSYSGSFSHFLFLFTITSHSRLLSAWSWSNTGDAEQPVAMSSWPFSKQTICKY